MLLRCKQALPSTPCAFMPIPQSASPAHAQPSEVHSLNVSDEVFAAICALRVASFTAAYDMVILQPARSGTEVQGPQKA